MDYLSKSDVVAQGIRGLIHSGELAPGDVLRQRDLAKRFQVSPTPVRDRTSTRLNSSHRR